MTESLPPDDLYRRHATAVADLVETLDPTALESRVPATPAWRVHDVVAHLAGGPTELLAGRIEGSPSEAWTAHHVGERASRPIADVVAELRGNVEPVAKTLVPRFPRIMWDVATHHADLLEALERGPLPDPWFEPVLMALAPRRAPALLARTAPDGPISRYELFRALFSRRSRAQIQAWGVTAEETETLGVFGARDDDQPVPG